MPIRFAPLFAVLAVVTAGLVSSQAVAQYGPVPTQLPPDGVQLPSDNLSPSDAYALPEASDTFGLVTPQTYFSPSLTAQVTGTTNSTFGAGRKEKDVIFDLVPRVVLYSEHSHVRIKGDFSLDGELYALGTLNNRVLPRGSLELNSKLIDRLLYFDASAQSQQNVANPYAGKLQSATGQNQFTTTQYRVSPYIDRRITPTLRFYARSDNTWTQVSGNNTTAGIFGGRYGVQTIRLEQQPLPVGFALLGEYTDSKFNNLPNSSLTDASIRAIGNYQVTRKLLLGLIGGYEKVDVFLASVKRPIWGGRFLWQNGNSARIDAIVEDRYFGTGWNVQAFKRTGTVTFLANWNRQATTFLSSQFGGAATGVSIGSLLDGALASQYPNPVTRTAAVQNLLTSSGLPSTLSGADNLYSQAANLQTNANVTALLLRERNSYAISVYHNRTEDLFLPGQQVLQLAQTLSNDSVQTGVALTFARRLSQITRLSVQGNAGRARGFGLNAGQRATQYGLLAEIDHALSPRTNMRVGFLQQFLKSTAVSDANESALFVALTYAF